MNLLRVLKPKVKRKPKNLKLIKNKKNIQKNKQLSDTQIQKIYRKIRTHGNSPGTISIPPKWLQELGLEEHVWIEFHTIDGVPQIMIKGAKQ